MGRRSVPFIVDAAPSPGSVEIRPLQGQALKTSFSFSTDGWLDEAGDSGALKWESAIDGD